MKASVFCDVRQVRIQQLETPAPPPQHVLVRVDACGVCGTDVHIFEGKLTEGVAPPVVLGHEITGRIEAVGPGVAGLQVGQRVAVDPVVGCGQCPYCHAGRPNLCPAPTIVGYKRDGGFAQFTVVPASHVCLLDEALPPKAGILVETLACVLHGYDRLGFRAGSSAMILGAGTVGLLWNQLLVRSAKTLLIQSEPVAFRRHLAEQLGADVVIDPDQEDLPARVRQVAPEGVDFIIDASGQPEAVEQAIPLVRKSGTFMIFGVCPAGSRIRLDPHLLYQREMRIIASKMPPLTLDRAARLLEGGLIDYERIVTTELGLGQLAEALEQFNSARDRHVKMMINPWS